MLEEQDWVKLGLACQARVFEPFDMICRKDRQAFTVFLILGGEIAVTKLKRKCEAEDLKGKNLLAVLKHGVSFGELGVLYKTKR